MYQLYKFLVYVPWLMLWTVTNFVGILLVAPFSRRRASRWFGRMWGRGLMYGVPATVRVTGREHIDSGASYIVVCNHLSLIDIPLLYGWLPVDFKWIMKKEVRRIPLVGVATAIMGHIFLDRANHRSAARELENLKDTLPENTSILFFPEGTRSRNGELQVFKMGAFKLARELGMPILPITIVGADRILTPDGMDLHPGAARMVIHAALGVDQVGKMSNRELRDMAQARVASALNPANA